MKLTPTRRVLARTARIIIACFLVIPTLVVMGLEFIAKNLKKVTDFYYDGVTVLLEKVDIVLWGWQSNSPEGTMERLKKVESNNED